MAESITISRNTPEKLSMQYEFLRDKGVTRIQELAGKIWTDYNSHDPGVTILEVLSYAITDLGYRTTFEIKDLITPDPNDPHAKDIENFFTACEILPNCPVTFNDYRKLLIDVDVHSNDTGCEFAGVKNAWIEKSGDAECPYYVDFNTRELSLSPTPNDPNPNPMYAKVLYDVLIEFDKCDAFGDLNEDNLQEDLIIYDHPLDTAIQGVRIRVRVDFPRWDSDVDFTDQAAIKEGVRGITLTFFNMPDGYDFQYFVDNQNNVLISGTRTAAGPSGVAPVPGLVDIANTIDDFIYNPTTGLIAQYQAKVEKIGEILDAVRARVMANRNLCEDFFRFNALRVEEIAICSDIELAVDANVEETEAKIYHEISKFLSPQVTFYTLTEMFDKGKTSDEIFEGPKLTHGFIDDDELKAADCKEQIHVSDLIQIIMDIPGVIAVKSIQIANLPQDTTEGVESKSVKWCLDLACAKNFVPRLTIDQSKITFFKDQLPFKANQLEVETILEGLETEERPQKIHPFPNLDIPVPTGEYKDLEDYVSIQDEFPLTYGIGEEGLRSSVSDLRKAQAKQLKGFLMFFDQLLADYLAQMAHIKDLFSFNGNIDRSYYTQPLFNIVPDVDPLYVDKIGHEAALNAIAEDEELFTERRNRFLDHLLARFGESFSDYALLSYRISGPKSATDLLEDKLNFLNSYPAISASRGKGFNYADSCLLWNVDNVAGLNKRVSLLTGIDPYSAEKLNFKQVALTTSTGGSAPYGFEVLSLTGVPGSASENTYDTIEEVNKAIEKLIVAGQCEANYQLLADTESTGSDLRIGVFCEGELMTTSFATFPDEVSAEAAIQDSITIFGVDFYDNNESNRRNLSCPLNNYFSHTVIANMDNGTGQPPSFTISFTMFENSLEQDTGDNTLLTGTYTEDAEEGDTETQVLAKGEAKVFDVLWDVVTNGINRAHYLFETLTSGDYVFNVTDRVCTTLATSVEVDFNDSVADEIENQISNSPAVVTVSNSTANDGTYTVVSATASGPSIDIEVSEAIGSLIFDGTVSFTETFTIDSISADDKTFSIIEDITGKLEAGDGIFVDNSTANDGNYTIVSINYTGSQTDIVVEEVIPSDVVIDGDINYTKSYPITAINNGTGQNSFVVKGGGDDKAVDDMIAFINDKFFNHEGFHIVEHTLLRPKVKQTLFVDTDNSTLADIDTGEAAGSITFAKTITILAADGVANSFELDGDITAELTAGMFLRAENTQDLANDGLYTLTSGFSYDIGSDTTTIIVMEEVIDATSTGGVGDLTYSRTIPVSDTDPSTIAFVFTTTEVTDHVQADDEIQISGSEDGVNDGTYLVGSTTTSPSITVVVSQKKTDVRDDLLTINIDDECEDCNFEDPYSCVMSIVMPYWQGRFINQDFRRFFERAIRLETPAHIALNICWVNCEQLEEFETKYKAWLVENSKEIQDPVTLSAALNELINILGRLSTVYPVGTLHDCEEGEENIASAIILNNSMLGTL
jgi:hypothetical protein